MPTVYLSIGSNVEPAANIRSAIKSIREAFGELLISPTYENAPVGFDGDNFYNLVLAFDTDNSVQSVAGTLRQIEAEHGRTREESKFSSRTLDLDLLLYGDLVEAGDGYHVPRDEITKYAFVLLPLAQIAADLLHPVVQMPISDMLEKFTGSLSGLKLLDISY